MDNYLLLGFLITNIFVLTFGIIIFYSVKKYLHQFNLLNANQSDTATNINKNFDERFRYLEELNHRLTQTLKDTLLDKFAEVNLQQQKSFSDHRQQFDKRQMESLKILQDSLYQGLNETRNNVKETLLDYANQVNKRVEYLTQITDERLKEINGQVEKRLSEGFEKTTQTFSDVIKRLAMIDAAQQKITELSNNVVSLQDILNDKRSRGAFGEIQLAALIRNVMPEQHFSFQHTLSNGKRADCILFLPEPTGNMVIDAKFPLESFKIIIDNTIAESERILGIQQFKKDLKKHIQDIAEKYILTDETADGAIMFIPAEAIFAEIHANHQDIIESAYRAKVWLVSPTTMMAVLTTARAVLKDAATRKQVHIIQKHLNLLSTDFERFRKRMDKLATHIAQANSDVEDVHTSAKKISARFTQIEKVEIETPLLDEPVI